MAENPCNAVNRGVYISDNLPFLRSLNYGCIDLVCIDPPFAKNGTLGRKNEDAPDPLKPGMMNVIMPSARYSPAEVQVRW